MAGLTDAELRAQIDADARTDAARARFYGGQPGQGGQPPGQPPAQTAGAGRPDGEVSLRIGQKVITGWTDIKIGGGLDRMPATFDLGLTKRVYDADDDSLPDILIPGYGVSVRIGGDLVIKGWINRIVRSVGPGGHMVRLQGRSFCQDLVDCSAELPNMSINSVAIGDLARQLIAPFKGPINLKLPDGNGDNRPYTFSISLGQTPFELIAQVAAYEGLLVHDDAEGDLVICKVGTEKFASGFREGANLEEWTVNANDDQLYSTYIPVLMAQDTLAAFGSGGNNAGSPVQDTAVTRYRPLIVVSDQSDPVTGQFLAQKRAIWEATRRRGRAQSVQLVCDSWRDSAGRLWTHNMLAPVHIPSCGLLNQAWLVTEWELARDEKGTRASITLMPPDAFAVEPSALNGVNWQIAQAARVGALGRNNPNAGPAVTAPNAGANGNPRAGDGAGL